MRVTQQRILPTSIKNRHFGDIITQDNTTQASYTISSGSGTVIPLSVSTPPFRNFASVDFTLYEGSVSDANRIPDGSNVTAADYQIIGPWNDLLTTDNNNTQTKIYVGNVSTTSGTVTNRVGSDLQNVWDTLQGGTWAADTFSETVGVLSESPSPDKTFNLSLRFTSITIPQAATINSAKITFISVSTHTSTVTTTIYGIAEDNTAAFTTSPIDDARTRTHTSATVAWTQSQPSLNTAYDTADISTIVQEIVNRSGWASGNAMGFYIENNGTTTGNYLDMRSYSDDPTKAALLTITYTAAGASKTVIIKFRPRYMRGTG